MKGSKVKSGFLLLLVIILSSCADSSTEKVNNQQAILEQKGNQKARILHKKKEIDGFEIFYRESGNPSTKAVILLHGFPSSSHQYRTVLETLGNDYYVIAPDYPAFGESSFKNRNDFEYSFDTLTDIMELFVETFQLESYALMMHDYGGPIGFRLAERDPKKVSELIVLNANIYEEGLGEAWKEVRNLWENNTVENRDNLRKFFEIEAMKWQYTHGVKAIENISPQNWVLDTYNMQNPKIREIQLDLFYDYKSNLANYPSWQNYLRENQPKTLVLWGKNDAFFPESGALAYKKDLNKVSVHFYDTGHFALEEYSNEINQTILEFLGDSSQQ